MPKVTEVNSLEQLDQYYLAWQSVWRQTPQASLFQHIEWLKLFWEHFGQANQLRVLVVESCGNLVGILPLVIQTEETRVGKVRVLTYPLQDWGTFYGPLGPNPTATLAAATSYLSSQSTDWDLFDLRWVNRHDVDRGRTPLALERAGFTARESVWKEVAVVDTTGCWDDYFAGRSAKLRENVRRSFRRLKEKGKLEFQRYRPGGNAGGNNDPNWDLYDACVQVAEKSWQGDSDNGTTLSTPSVADFFRDTHALAAKLGMLDMGTLRLDGEVIAFSYNYHQAGRVTGLRIGFDPALKKFSLGSLMQARMYRDSFERTDHTFDLGPGYFDIKKNWMTGTESSYRYTVYGNTPKAMILRAKHWIDSRRPAVGKGA